MRRWRREAEGRNFHFWGENTDELVSWTNLKLGLFYCTTKPLGRRSCAGARATSRTMGDDEFTYLSILTSHKSTAAVWCVPVLRAGAVVSFSE